MSMTATPLRIPADVQKFADQRGLGPYLAPLIDALHRVFADAALSVELHHDPEAESLSWILFEAEVAGWTIERTRIAEKEWRISLQAACPSDKATMFSLVIYQGA